MAEEIQYILNAAGERIAVIVSIEEFENMLAKLGLTLDEYLKEPSAPLTTVLDRLRADGRVEL